MTVALGIIFALIGCVIGIITFFVGQKTAAKNDGERWGKLDANMEHMLKSIIRIEAAFEKGDKANKESIRRVHERIDEHLRTEHGKAIPKRESE